MHLPAAEGLSYGSWSLNIMVTSIKTPPRMMDTERSKVRWVRSMLADKTAIFISDWYSTPSFFFSSRRISETTHQM